MPNWEEETGEVASQRNARIWSVNYLLDSFSFLIDYGIYIPRQKIIVSEAACTTYGTGGQRVMISDTPCRLPSCQLQCLRTCDIVNINGLYLDDSSGGTMVGKSSFDCEGLLTWSVLVFGTVIYPHTLHSDYVFP